MLETPLWTVQKNFLSQSGCLKTFLIVSGCLKTAQNCFCQKTEDWRGSLLHKLKESWSTASRCVLFQVARTHDDEQWCIAFVHFLEHLQKAEAIILSSHHFLSAKLGQYMVRSSLSRSQNKLISTSLKRTEWRKVGQNYLLKTTCDSIFATFPFRDLYLSFILIDLTGARL